MTRREKREINRELAALASLRDSDIDTSDIPEITNWSQAASGRFHPSAKIGPSRPTSSDVGFTPRPLPNPIPVPQPSTGTAVAAMAHQELTLACIQGQAEAWREFIRRFQQLIAVAVLRATREWGATSPEVIEDLVQDVYVKLAAENGKVLQGFETRDDSSFFRFLKVVAANVVNDYFRTAYPVKRGAGSISAKTSKIVPLESPDSDAKAEREILLAEIDRILKATTASDRDRKIFLLFYRDGLSAKEIANILEFDLSVKGVESAILRLTKLVRHQLAKVTPARQSQRGTLTFKKKDQ